MFSSAKMSLVKKADVQLRKPMFNMDAFIAAAVNLDRQSFTSKGIHFS